MTKQLRISPQLSLPLDAATESFGVLGQRGSGKSNVAVVFAEEMWKSGVPWVAIDPKGDWYGVRSSADGTGPGLPIPVFGGLHGDVPLERLRQQPRRAALARPDRLPGPRSGGRPAGPVPGGPVTDRRYRRVARISTAGFVTATVACITVWPGAGWACAALIAGLLLGPFVGAYLDCREDARELELALLRRRAMFSRWTLPPKDAERFARLLSRRAERSCGGEVGISSGLITRPKRVRIPSPATKAKRRRRGVHSRPALRAAVFVDSPRITHPGKDPAA